MPGMMKAARRRKSLARQITEVELPTAFFNQDIMGTAWGSTAQGDPVLMFVLGCDPETAHEYVQELAGATLHVVDHECYVALVAVKDGQSLGRLTTSLGSPLALVVDRLKSLDAAELHLGIFAIGAQDIPPFALPVVVQDGVVEDFEPIEMGSGGFVCFCMNVHTGVAYAHRFETQAEAAAQRARNEAVDRPFVGLATN